MSRYALFDDIRGEIYLPGNAGSGGARFMGCPGCPKYADCAGGPGCSGCPGFEDVPDCFRREKGPEIAECADCIPADCARWKKSLFACPACLEFAERTHPLPRFAESFLLVRDDGVQLCLECGEFYRDTADLALRALENLKDALNDQNWLAEQLTYITEKNTSPREP